MNPMMSSAQAMQQQADGWFAQGNYAEAATLYEQLVTAEPDVAAHYWALGLAQLLQGLESDAQLIWSMAIAQLDTEQADEWTLDLLHRLEAEANHQEAQERLVQALLIRQHIREIHPDDLNNQLRCVQLALQLDQFDPGDLAETGLLDQVQPGASLDLALLDQVGRQLLEAAPQHPVVPDFVEHLVALLPDPSDWIALLLELSSRLTTVFANYPLACRYAELCLRLDPEQIGSLLRVSHLYQDLERYREGVALAERALARCDTPIQQLVANSVRLRGLMLSGNQWSEAQAALQQNTELMERLLVEYTINPDVLLETSIICTPLFFYPYLNDAPRQTRSLQNRMANLYQTNVLASIAKHTPDYQPFPQAPLVRSGARRKIRVGWLSRSMRMHSVGWLSRWLFRHYDRDRFEFYVYFNQQANVEPFSKTWFANPATAACCVEGDILGTAKIIRDDEIDILVDLDSLTADLNIGVMALKPAPVQVTWLGLDASGLPAIDYFMADPYVLPESAQEYYTEQIWRLPQTYIAVDGFEASTPTWRRDQMGIPSDAVIYFSAQISFKRHPDTARQQLRILKAVPNSYFLLKNVGDEKAIRTFFEQLADEEGVSRDRLRFLPRDPDEFTHRANLAMADVVLDTFPYNGATTTLETLWMGVPLVTQIGQQFASRNSYTMMLNAGVTEGIAQTPDEYVEWGIRLGQDAALRERIHWTLLRSRQTAPLWNARQFTRDMEQAFEQMWQRYCDRAGVGG